MSYPTFDQLIGSKFIPKNGIQSSRSVGGQLTTSSLFGTTLPGTYQVIHRLTKTDLDTLLAHYDSNYDAEFSFTFTEDELANQSAVTVVYQRPPQYSLNPGFNTYQVRTFLDKVI
jgi:hypothetical protein